VAVCLAFALYQGLIIGSNLGAFTVALHPGERERFFRENTDFYEVYQALQFLNKKVPKPVRFDRVLFLAEVRAFYCKADWLAPTVFNVNPLETALRECERPDKAAWRLRGQGFSHLLVNWAEFQRLRRTYGAFEDFDFKKWEAFRDACLEPLASFGPKDKAGECPIVVYAIKKEGQADRPAAR
jgi:hypothetical protein